MTVLGVSEIDYTISCLIKLINYGIVMKGVSFPDRFSVLVLISLKIDHNQNKSENIYGTQNNDLIKSRIAIKQ